MRTSVDIYHSDAYLGPGKSSESGPSEKVQVPWEGLRALV